jgi:hypothetical protein
MDDMEKEVAILDGAAKLYGNMSGTLNSITETLKDYSRSTIKYNFQNADDPVAATVKVNIQGAQYLRRMVSDLPGNSGRQKVSQLNKTSKMLSALQYKQNKNGAAINTQMFDEASVVIDHQVSQIAIQREALAGEFERLNILALKNDLNMVVDMVSKMMLDMPDIASLVNFKKEDPEWVRVAEGRTSGVDSFDTAVVDDGFFEEEMALFELMNNQQ